MRLLAVLLVIALQIGGDPSVPPPFVLPGPTGPFPVGTMRWVIDEDTARAMTVVAWYPSARRGANAPYLREGLIEAQTFSRLFFRGREDGFDDLTAVRTHAAVDVPLATTPARFPLLVFSHGYTGLPSAHTALVEDLASHGYVVLSVVHPGGSILGMLDEAGNIRVEIRDVLDEWAKEDATMAAVTKAPTEEAQRELLRAYLATLPNTTRVVNEWTTNVTAAMRSLPPPLARRVEPGRFGALGHSMGGVVAAEVCRVSAACRAAANLDGIPQSGALIDARLDKPLLMVYSARPGRLGANDAIYRRAARPYYRADVSGTLHLDFSDMTFWAPLRARKAVGPIDPVRVTDITRRLVRQFFDQALRHRRSTLLAGGERLEGVAVRQVR